MLQAEQILHDRYKLIRKLGQNNGHQTWFAQDLAQHPPESVILKLLAFGDQVQWDNLKLFEREAQILRQLQHPQIPRYRDSFTIDDRILWFGLVQEYVPGMLLKDQLAQQGRLSEATAKKLAIEILKILCYLHELSPPVLHRDIKPSNLILGSDHRVHLIDFGAVQDRAAKEGATFTVVGTYGYTPMEQFGGRAVAASDLYALGATLIHTVTGVAPADLPQEKLRLQFRDRATLHPEFADWLQIMTEPDPAKRFQTARQALAVLQDLQRSSKPQPQTAHLLEPAVPSRPLAESRLDKPRSIELLDPYSGLVQLHKTPATLVITYPGDFHDSISDKIQKNLGRIYAALCCLAIADGIAIGISVSSFTPILLIAFPLLWLSMAISPIVGEWFSNTPTTVHFDRNRYWLQLQKGGIPLTGTSLAEIKSITGSSFISHPRRGIAVEQQQVVLQTKQRREIGIGRGLSAQECKWLATEIRSWLSEVES